jgi:hypothetical protein
MSNFDSNPIFIDLYPAGRGPEPVFVEKRDLFTGKIISGEQLAEEQRKALNTRYPLLQKPSQRLLEETFAAVLHPMITVTVDTLK